MAALSRHRRDRELARVRMERVRQRREERRRSEVMEEEMRWAAKCRSESETSGERESPLGWEGKVSQEQWHRPSERMKTLLQIAQSVDDDEKAQSTGNFTSSDERSGSDSALDVDLAALAKPAAPVAEENDVRAELRSRLEQTRKLRTNSSSREQHKKPSTATKKIKRSLEKNRARRDPLEDGRNSPECVPRQESEADAPPGSQVNTSVELMSISDDEVEEEVSVEGRARAGRAVSPPTTPKRIRDDLRGRLARIRRQRSTPRRRRSSPSPTSSRRLRRQRFSAPPEAHRGNSHESDEDRPLELAQGNVGATLLRASYKNHPGSVYTVSVPVAAPDSVGECAGPDILLNAEVVAQGGALVSNENLSAAVVAAPVVAVAAPIAHAVRVPSTDMSRSVYGASVDNGPELHITGWLHKLSHFFFKKVWRRRFFVFDVPSKTLFVCKDRSHFHAEGFGSTKRYFLGEPGITLKAVEGETRGHVFSICKAEETLLTLSASSAYEMQRWMTALLSPD